MSKRKKQRRTEQTPRHNADQKLPFIEHLYELRRRLFYVALSVIVFSALGYFVQQQLVGWLLRPSKGQQFIYTTPAGGLNFLFQVCIYFGLTLSIPVMIYQILRYMEPLLRHHHHRSMLRFGMGSWLLAIVGAVFGYYVGLPVALHFLSHQFTTAQIKPLLTIQEYMSFVTLYLMGSALLFQIPLILAFINRIRPMPPRKLLGFERYYVALAFIAAAIMTPTPDMFNQLLFVGPILAAYQVGIVCVYLQNRRRGHSQAQHTAAPAAPAHFPPNPFLTEPLIQPGKPVDLSPVNNVRRRPVMEFGPVSHARRRAVWDIG